MVTSNTVTVVELSNALTRCKLCTLQALGGAVAVASYNGGAADYKETEEYQAAVQNQKEADELGAESAEAPSVAGD